MRIFESILDDQEVSNSTVSVADIAISKSDIEFPSPEKYHNTILFANGNETYEEILHNPDIMYNRFELLLETIEKFRHIISHSDFSFGVHPMEYDKSMPYYVREGYDLLGYAVSFDAKFRTATEAFKFIYTLNEIATGNKGGSVDIQKSNTDKLFIDYEYMDWIAEYLQIPTYRNRSHNIFYDKEKVINRSNLMFDFLSLKSPNLS